MKSRTLRILLVVLLAAVSLVIIPQIGSRDSGKTGEELARTHCGSCHGFTEPGLLDKKTWTEGVLPEMGLRMGIGDRNVVLNRMSFQLFDKLCNIGVYPDKPVISAKEWKRIVAYYEKNAPEKLTDSTSSFSYSAVDTPFVIRTLPVSGQGQITLSRFMPERREIWVCSRSNEWRTFAPDGSLKSNVRVGGTVVDVLEGKNPMLLSIGNMLPNEDRNGRLLQKSSNGNRYEILLDSLHRPVQFLRTDMDGDGIEDWLVAEFGFETGRLRWFDGKDKTPRLLTEKPGARSLIPLDADADGDTDILALFAQAREEVVLFRNEGSGTFKPVSLLSFPPIYGSSSLEWADMNNDGHGDLVIAYGDNADYSIVPKPYHGIRIFLNDGRFSFRQSAFLPVNGATKVLARDFDLDGDNDMAMIAFFAIDKDRRSFLYFENDGKGGFKASNLGVPAGHWLVMDAQDMDADGDEDIVLGNFLMAEDPNEKKGSETVKSVLLENRTSSNGTARGALK
jgi:hypothetical protein